MHSAKPVRSVRSIQTAKTGYLIVSAALCVLGVLLMVFPGISARALCYILGGILTVYGIIKMVGYFSRDLYRLAFQYDLASGSLITALGVIMLLVPDGVISVTHTVIGILILADGLFKIQIAIDARRFGVGKWWLITIFAILTGIAGLLLILHPFAGAEAAVILLGAALLAEGILSFSVALCAVKIIRHQQPDVIEISYTENGEDH
ncbi:MAG: HdeD family acid-resistance protein [Candidatus Merdivicinus sp.]|jgi:uncharacterized membrane protein HdeD (DUF308 family)